MELKKLDSIIDKLQRHLEFLEEYRMSEGHQPPDTDRATNRTNNQHENVDHQEVLVCK